jgi:autotransporter translocation and assembly factor TamB
LTKAEFGKVVRMFYKDFSANGILNASFKLGGIHNNINISGKAFIEKASVYNIPFDSASINLSYANKELSLEKIKITKGKSILNGECKLSADKSFSYRAISERLFIKDIGLDRLPGDAIISVQSEGHGTFDNPDITLNAKLLDTSLKGSSLGGGILTASIKNRDILLNASLFNEKLIIKGNGHFDDTLPWNAEFDIHSGRYDFIISSILKDVPEDLHLDLKGHATMKGDKKNISASANLNHITLSLFGQTFSNDSDINFSLNNRNLALKNFTLKSGTTSLRIQGSMEIGKQYDVVLDGSSSLSPLKGLSKKIGYLKGDADFVFSVNGKWEKPQINGGMNLSNASFGLRDYPSSYISSIYGYLYVDENRIVLQRLSGKIGGGDINVSGVVYLEAFSFKRFYVEANMKDVTAVFSKDFNINYDGNLLYKGTMDTQSISGDIKINRAKYKEMIEWRSWLLTKEKKEKPRTEASVFDKAELNIRVTGSNNISIDNNMARAPIKVDIVLKGTLLSPVLIGRLESSEGYAYFRNNEFRIIFASADFTDPNRINPYINLTAETTISGYDIRLILEGQLDRFNLSLSSDPHLEESDILSLLTVGQLGKQTQGLEKGIGAGEATTFLTGKAQDVFEERLRSLTGLDRFQVEPYVSKTTGAISPRVTVSKRLIGDRLFVTYATLIGETEEQVLKLEYRLDKNISLIGTRDELGSIGGDIKFRFEFK